MNRYRKKYRIDGPLSEAKLYEYLKMAAGPSRTKKEVPIEGTKYRLDMTFLDNFDEIGVEFDGPRHYCDVTTVVRDAKKDAVAREHDYWVVRIPYWLQLTTQTALEHLNIKGVIVQDFPHGFITTKVFPASFCEIGLERFKAEMSELSINIRQDVAKSLVDQAAKRGVDLVIPPSIRSLMDIWVSDKYICPIRLEEEETLTPEQLESQREADECMYGIVYDEEEDSK